MKNKLLIISITLLTTFILVAWFLVFPLMVNKEAVKNELKASFEAATGMKLEIQGEAVLRMSVIPYLSIDSLYVVNSAGTGSPFFLKIKNIDIWPVFTSMFKKQIAIRKIVMTGVDIDVETLNGGRQNWQEVSKYWSDGVFNAGEIKQVNAAFDGMTVVIENGHLGYSDSKSGFSADLNEINVTASIDDEGKANSELSLSYKNRHYVASGSINGMVTQIFSGSAMPVELRITSEHSEAYYKGSIGYKNNKPVVNGDLKIDADDFAYWVRLYRHKAVNNDIAGYKKLPLGVKTRIIMDDDKKVVMKDIALDGEIIKGNAAVEITLPDQVNIKSVISKLNLDNVVENMAMEDSLEVKNDKSTKQADHYDVTVQPVANTVSVSSDIKIGDIVYNNKHISDTYFYADMAGDEMTIPQFITNLPGDTVLSFSGIGRYAIDGLTIEGQIDAQGSNIIQALSLLKSGGVALPPQDFKRFHLRTNTLVSSKELRLSEIIARIENIVVSGGLSAKFNERINLQAALGVRGINLDHVAELWGLRGERNVLLNKDRIGESQDGVISVWLKRLGYDMLVSALLEKYTLNGKLYDKANLTIGATEGKIEVGGNKIPYYDSAISGKVMLNVLNNIPKIDLHLLVDTLDLKKLFPDTDRKNQAGKGKWSTDVFDFGWFNVINGAYELKFGHLKYGDTEAEDVGLRGTLFEQKLNVEIFNLKIMGAVTAGRFAITGGVIPTFDIAADMSGLRIENLARLLPLLNGVDGLCNAHVNLSTNGVNEKAWVSNMQGAIGVRGRDIEVRGFNLPAVIRSVAYVRTVADILNVVKRAVPSGSTTFSSLEAQWNIVNGIVDASNANITNAQVEGNIVSRIDFVNWTGNTAVTFALKELDPVNTPRMTVKVTGDLDSPLFDFDTSAIEQYVNNKTSEKMLQDYGAH